MTGKFQRLCQSTLIAVYLLILAGGVVRSTGSGMGCPDWPTCFNQWIPPVDKSELPANYKDIYSEYRHKKNLRFVRYLTLVGADQTANQLLNDSSILEEADFNPVKTWIEYANRLLGVIVGFFSILLVVFSFPLRKNNLNLFLLSCGILLLVIIQGWFGSIVVSTNLTSWTITVHMFLALLVVALLSWLVAINSSLPNKKDRIPVSTYGLLGLCTAVLLIQIFLGTMVREEINAIALTALPKKVWIDHLGNFFLTHRSLSIAVLVLHLALLLVLRKAEEGRKLSKALSLLTVVALISGAGMAYFEIPAFLQPLHLALAAILFGLQCTLFYKLNLYFRFVQQH